MSVLDLVPFLLIIVVIFSLVAPPRTWRDRAKRWRPTANAQLHPPRPRTPPMGSIHAVAIGVSLVVPGWICGGLQLMCAAPSELTTALGLDLPLLHWVPRVLIAVGGWRLFGPAPYERHVWARRILAAAWFVTLAPMSPATIVIAAATALLSLLHIVSHTRPGTPVGRRARVDAGMLAVLVTIVTALALTVPDAPREADGTIVLTWWQFVGGFVALSLAVAWMHRGDKLKAALAPGSLPDAWPEAVERLGGAIVRAERTAWEATIPLGDRDLTVRVCRDPVPPWTELELPVPELRRVVARRRRPDDVGGVSWGHMILDAQLFAEGDAQLAATLGEEDGPWPEILHGWHGELRDGVLVARFDGDLPCPEWLGQPARDRDADFTLIDHLVERCREAVAAVAPAPPPTAARAAARARPHTARVTE